MAPERDLSENELMGEIISVRFDTLWKMLRLGKEVRLPRIDEEGATGKLDNKGKALLWLLERMGLDHPEVLPFHIGDMGCRGFWKPQRSSMNRLFLNKACAGPGI